MYSKKYISLNNRRYALDSIVLAIVIVLTLFLLLLRDYIGLSVGKHIFIVLFAGAIMYLPLDKSIYLFSFLIPLYVGIPGNYVTLLMALRILLNNKALRINKRALLLCILTGLFVFVSGLVTRNTSMSEILFFPALLVITLLFFCAHFLNKKDLIIFYSFGVASLGLIMLFSTLKVYPLSSLLSSSFRLGEETMQFIGGGEMHINIDPNFYGIFVISSISIAVQALKDKLINDSLIKKLLLILSMISSLVVAFIGLSRSFVICFILWAALFLISQKNYKVLIIYCLVLLLVIGSMVVILPDVTNAIMIRFDQSDIISGNGRLELINSFFKQWSSSFYSIILGVGVFRCNVHCTPLQILFGGGFVLMFLYSAYLISLYNSNPVVKENNDFSQLLPIFVSVFLSLTIPGFLLINSMFPIYFTMLINNIKQLPLTNKTDSVN